MIQQLTPIEINSVRKLLAKGGRAGAFRVLGRHPLRTPRRPPQTS